MNRRILIQVTTPAVLIGLVFCAACLVSAWHVNLLQRNMTDILTENVSSLQAAQQLEISGRQLRFHCFLYLIDPDPALLREINADNEFFAVWLQRADQSANTPIEQGQVRRIREGYDRYQQEFGHFRGEVERGGPRRDFRSLRLAHPIRHIVAPCREYLQVNEEMMTRTARDSAAVSWRLHCTMLLLGAGGPLGGLLSGYGIARGLSRSLHQLSVRVQDAAHQLNQDVADVRLTANGDLRDIDQQLQHVVGRVTEVMMDLQRQQREILRAEQLAAVGHLAASVAHEVRNPLTSIKMLVEAALRQHKPRPFTPDKLRIVHHEVRRLEQRVQDFLNFARPPALERGDCDLGELVAQSIDLVRARARQQKVQIDFRCPEDPLTGLVDRGQLCTVLVNLLLNALDAMPRGGRLEVALRRSQGKGITMTVTDTGEGIRPEMVPYLFEPFASNKPTGSGLGLSICKRVVEEHEGTITGTNGPGGACFTVTLPITGSEEDHAATPGR